MLSKPIRIRDIKLYMIDPQHNTIYHSKQPKTEMYLTSHFGMYYKSTENLYDPHPKADDETDDISNHITYSYGEIKTFHSICDKLWTN